MQLRQSFCMSFEFQIQSQETGNAQRTHFSRCDPTYHQLCKQEFRESNELPRQHISWYFNLHSLFRYKRHSLFR